MHRSLSPEERKFIADQLEPITTMPVSTAKEEDAWYAATRATMQRLNRRFADVASIVPHQLYHYFDDAEFIGRSRRSAPRGSGTSGFHP